VNFHQLHSHEPPSQRDTTVAKKMQIIVPTTFTTSINYLWGNMVFHTKQNSAPKERV